MSKVINPTESDITIQYRGVTYNVVAGGSISNVPEDAASYWQTMIHNFIVIADEEAQMPTETVVAPVVSENTDIEEVTPEVKVEEEVEPEETKVVAPKKTKK